MSARDGKRTTLPPLADLAADLRDGLTVVDLAATFGITASQLQARLNRAGWDAHGGPLVDTPPRREPVVGFLQGDTSWMGGALCAQADSELFFGERGKGAKQAKALCSRCDVRAACEEWADAAGESWGIWGGGDRTKRRKRKGAAA